MKIHPLYFLLAALVLAGIFSVVLLLTSGSLRKARPRRNSLRQHTQQPAAPRQHSRV